MADEITEMEGTEFDGDLFGEPTKSGSSGAKYMADVIANLSDEKARNAAYIANALETEKKNVQGCLNMLVKSELATVKEHKESKTRFYMLNQTNEETVELREKILKAGKDVTKVSDLE